MGWNIRQRDDTEWELTDNVDVDPPIVFGRGVTDKDITYLALRNESGTLVYIYPDALGTGVTVSTSKP